MRDPEYLYRSRHGIYYFRVGEGLDRTHCAKSMDRRRMPEPRRESQVRQGQIVDQGSSP